MTIITLAIPMSILFTREEIRFISDFTTKINT